MTINRHVTEPAAMRAMAHPLRWRLYYSLTLAGSATATHLAGQINESTSLVSYHLRQLAEHGYIEPDPEPPGGGTDGRHRWWRPTSEGFNFMSSDFDNSPESAAALAQARLAHDAQHAAYRQAWLDSQAEWSQDWRNAAVTNNNPTLKMTPTELADLADAYTELVDRWKKQIDAAGEDPARKQIMLTMQAFPFQP